jgi:hypothetical protein
MAKKKQAPLQDFVIYSRIEQQFFSVKHGWGSLLNADRFKEDVRDNIPLPPKAEMVSLEDAKDLITS